MIYGNIEIDYEQMARKAMEKNIGFFLRKMARRGEIKKGASGGRRIKTSKYKGVRHIDGSRVNPWVAVYRKKYLGCYRDEELAHQAYQFAVSKYKRKKKRMRLAA